MPFTAVQASTTSWLKSQAYLCAAGCYCVLGIAAELFRSKHTPRILHPDGFIRFDGHSASPPGYVTAHLALLPSAWGKLVDMNDYEDLTFPQIAAEIRKNPARFFNHAA